MGIQKPPRYKWKIHRQAAGNLSSVLTENDGRAAGSTRAARENLSGARSLPHLTMLLAAQPGWQKTD